VKQLIDKARRCPIFAQADQLSTVTVATNSSSCPHLGRIVAEADLFGIGTASGESEKTRDRRSQRGQHLRAAACGNGTLLAFVRP
jgi:hypothetical protein